MKGTGRPEQIVTRMLARADIVPGGERPWDMQIHDARVFRRILVQGSLGLGHSYVAGQWDCTALDQLFFRLMRPGAGRQAVATPSWYRVRNRLFNLQSERRALSLQHYDIGNELFQAMLDLRMVYSCGYWKEANTLAEAQEAKLELVCRKLGLQPGMRVLDIGCGWGSFMKYAAERHGVSCVGITISAPQAELGSSLCADLPVQFLVQDYRSLSGKFDAIVSIGMFEHVGHKNHRRFMEIVRACLDKEGLMLLHTIGAKSSATADAFDPWLSTQIFRDGELPGMKQLSTAIDGLLTLEDWHNFGADYDPTLMAWHDNFETSWPRLRQHYDEQFRRRWRYYLLGCAGLFRARAAHVWQLVLARKGVRGGYRSLR